MTDAAALHIYERWHESAVRRDLDGIAALYAEDALFESPLVWATAGGDGVLRGRPAITAFFAVAFRAPETGLGRWYRTGTVFSDGRQLTWEYPRATPDGDQVDLVEVMDLADGLIAHHRVYWGWVGSRALAALRDSGAAAAGLSSAPPPER